MKSYILYSLWLRHKRYPMQGALRSQTELVYYKCHIRETSVMCVFVCVCQCGREEERERERESMCTQHMLSHTCAECFTWQSQSITSALNSHHKRRNIQQATVQTLVAVPEKRGLNEANFILRYKPFKNVCYIETNVNFKLHWIITLG